MSDEIAPVEGAASPESAAEPATEPWAGVMDRVNELAGNIDTRFGALEQRIPAPQAEEPPDPWAALTGGQDEEPQYFDQFGNPVELPQQPAFDPAALQQAVNAAIQQHNAPLVQQLQSLQAERGREQLYNAVPQLKDDDYAKEAIQNITQGLAAAQAPPEIAQWVSNNPWMIEQLVKAKEADKLAQAQVPAGEGVPALEAAGGAAPSGTNEQPDYIQSALSTGFRLPPGLA